MGTEHAGYLGSLSGNAAKAPPASILTRYNTVFNEIFNDPEFAKKWEASGSPVFGGSAQKFSVLILSEAERLGALVKELGIQADWFRYHFLPIVVSHAV